MKICKVVGNVWATRKHKSLKNNKLLLVQTINGISGRVTGQPMLAVDHSVDAGPGNIVLVNDEGNSARMMIEDSLAGVRTVVCGIIDELTVLGRNKKYH